MILTFYGTGKGKTSAALGLALRASGYNKKILFCQFIKGNWQTGEDEALKKIKTLTHKKFGIGFILPKDSEKRKAEHRQAAEKAIEFMQKNISKFGVIILDEALYAIKLKLIKASDIIKIIKANKKKDFIVTGGPKVDEIIKISDLVSQVNKIKHPFDKGIKAKKGIDW